MEEKGDSISMEKKLALVVKNLINIMQTRQQQLEDAYEMVVKIKALTEENKRLKDENAELRSERRENGTGIGFGEMIICSRLWFLFKNLAGPE